MTIIVNIIGLLLIVFIIWWFWLSKPKAITAVTNLIEIKIKNGVYDPALIQVKAKEPITLRFIREDGSACAETISFADLHISKILPLNVPTDIQLFLPKAGEYEFTCQMGMYRGKLIAA